MEYKRKKRKDGKTDLIRGIIHGAFVAFIRSPKTRGSSRVREIRPLELQLATFRQAKPCNKSDRADSGDRAPTSTIGCSIHPFHSFTKGRRREFPSPSRRRPITKLTLRNFANKRDTSRVKTLGVSRRIKIYAWIVEISREFFLETLEDVASTRKSWIVRWTTISNRRLEISCIDDNIRCIVLWNSSDGMKEKLFIGITLYNKKGTTIQFIFIFIFIALFTNKM